MSRIVVLQAGPDELFPYSLNKCDTQSEHFRAQLAHEVQDLNIIFRAMQAELYKPRWVSKQKMEMVTEVWQRVRNQCDGIRDRTMNEWYTVVGTRIRRRE